MKKEEAIKKLRDTDISEISYPDAVSMIAVITDTKPVRKKKDEVFQNLAAIKEVALKENASPSPAKKSPAVELKKQNTQPPVDKLHVVIPYINGPHDGIELRYALRSIEKNLKSDVVVILVGEKPEWAKNIRHIQSPRVDGMDYMSYMDVCNKIKTVCELKDIGHAFIYMYDDTFFMNPTDPKEIRTFRAMENMADVKKWFATTTASKKWCSLLEKTLKELISKKLPIYNYETHCPRFFEVPKLRNLIARYHPEVDPWMITTLYYNTFYPQVKPQLIAPYGADWRLGVYKTFTKAELLKKIKGRKILNLGKDIINDPEVRSFMDHLFPDKSKYEK